MNPQCPIVLASASPRRKELLSGMGIDFTVVPAEVEEISAGSGLPAEEMARLNACLKARSAADAHPEAIVIGSDTVVECSGRIFGKPHTAEEAFSMLRSLSGKAHRVISGVSLCGKNLGLDSSFTVSSRVVFKILTDADIQEYMSKVNVMDKAGAYAIQEHAELILKRLDGSLSNVIGLPVERLQQEFDRFAGMFKSRGGF